MATLTACVERDPDTGPLTRSTPGVLGAHSQRAALDEPNANLREVATLLLREDEGLGERLPRFVGLRQIEVG